MASSMTCRALRACWYMHTPDMGKEGSKRTGPRFPLANLRTRTMT